MTHDEHEGGPIDLSALRAGSGRRADPVQSPERWAAFVARIESAAAPELARRADLAAARSGVLTGPWLVEGVASAVARLTMPALVAAAAAIIAVIGVSWQGSQAAAEVSSATEMVATQLVSDDAAAWVTEQRELTTDDLARAIDPGADDE